MGAPIVFFEVISDDAERARRFYGELFDWTTDADPAMGGYALVDTGNGEDAVGGGIGPASEEDGPGVRIYARVDDLDAYLQKATKLGGTTIVEPQDLPGDYGKFAMFLDPDGNKVGLWS
ncbi:VOC family protein [Cryptosporangium minutisporangium]|uniref:VOC family protein n=1 Tax=Cryptosporangium minutisporangium TaxID=113569 RepID=A0ABP6SUX1_9ACTN